MRLRKIKGADEAIAESIYIEHNPKDRKGKWSELFGVKRPLHIEIGMGKGRFINTLASTNPEINYLGMELYSSVMIKALKKREELDVDNLFFLCENAKELDEFFEENELDRIYLNFSDPWPKDRHSKRRLTSEGFLESYHRALKPEGMVIFKTDNRGLFDFSVEEAKAHGEWFEILEVNYDLHNSSGVEGNVMTEYEEKFSSMGNPIFRLMLINKE